MNLNNNLKLCRLYEFNYSHLLLDREEELVYLEFISAVTEDILSRGHISERFVDISMPCVSTYVDITE